MSRANAWFERLISQGKAKAGQPLAHEGKIASGKNGRILTDGPFAESKEAIAGYVLLQVGDLDEAVENRQRVAAFGNTGCEHRSATGEEAPNATDSRIIAYVTAPCRRRCARKLSLVIATG